jgi:hypothetical protein
MNMTSQQDDSAAASLRNAAKSGFLHGEYGAALRLLFRARNFRHLPRLLREGPRPIFRLAIQAHNTAEIMRLLREGWPLNFVSSFPRSGNTWIRYLLADVFLQTHGVETATELPVHLDRIVPDFYCQWIARRNVTIPTPGVFVKTHETFPQLQERFGGAQRRPGAGGSGAVPPFRGCKHVYLYRSPEDALVSLFHYYDRQRQLKAKAAAGIDSFCQANLPLWEESLASYLRAEAEGFPVLFVPYELLLQYPTEILSSLLRWVGARHDAAMVERAVSNMQFSKLQAMEARSLFNEEAFFFRRGCKGSGRAELQPSTLDLIEERTAPLMEQANARVLIQQSFQGNPATSKTEKIRRDAAFQNRQSKRLPPVVKLQKV